MPSPTAQEIKQSPLAFWDKKMQDYISKFTIGSQPKKFQDKIKLESSSASSYIEAIKQMIKQTFAYENGVLHYLQKYSLIQIVGILVKRCKGLYQAYQDSYRIPTFVKSFYEYLEVQRYQKDKQQYLAYLKNLGAENEIHLNLIRYQQKLKEYQGKFDDMKKALDQAKRANNTRSTSFVNPEQRNIYLGQILLDQSDYKEYFVDTLQRFMGQTVRGSKVLYRMDLLNPTNFHKYIDNRPNIILIVLLKNGYAIAAFSEEAFSEKMELNKRGLISSLTNRKTFRSFKRAASYDRSHIIFGNSEVRILNAKNKVFSNIGISNGYYENTDSQVNILLGEGKQREAEMETYEVLEVFFK